MLELILLVLLLQSLCEDGQLLLICLNDNLYPVNIDIHVFNI